MTLRHSPHPKMYTHTHTFMPWNTHDVLALGPSCLISF